MTGPYVSTLRRSSARCPLPPVALGGMLFATLMLAVAGLATAKPRTAPAAQASQGETADAAEAALSLRLIRLHPATLSLVGDTLGWVKRCSGEPSVCIASRGFSLSPELLPTLKVSLTLTPRDGTHAVDVLVPLDQDLKDGLVVSDDGKDGHLGTYSRCTIVGCFGDVVLGEKGFDALTAAKSLDVTLVDVNRRTVTYQAPLDGLDAAIKGPALSNEDFVKAMQAAGKALVANMEAFQAKAKAERDAQQKQAAPGAEATADPASNSVKPGNVPAAADKPASSASSVPAAGSPVAVKSQE